VRARVYISQTKGVCEQASSENNGVAGSIIILIFDRKTLKYKNYLLVLDTCGHLKIWKAYQNICISSQELLIIN
jgi:hypothetical protein